MVCYVCALTETRLFFQVQGIRIMKMIYQNMVGHIPNPIEWLKERFQIEPTPPLLKTLIVENRKNGELIISYLRLMMIVLLIPAFLLRAYQGEMPVGVIYFTSVKLAIVFLVYFPIHYFLSKGWYHESIGYVLILLDTLFVSLCIVLVSFFKTSHEGVLKDPLIIEYFVICISSGIRFDFRHHFWGVFLCAIGFFSITTSDFIFHGIRPNVTHLSDVALFFTSIALATAFFIMRQRKFITKNYHVIVKQLKEISSIRDICRDISSRKEMEKMTTKILDETLYVLQADFGCILSKNRESGYFEHFVSRGAIGCDLEKIRLNSDGDPAIRHILTEKDFVYPHPEKKGETFLQGEIVDWLIEKEKMQSFIAITLNFDGQENGIFIAANRRRKVYSDYERNLAGVLLEQVSISARMAALLKKIERREVYVPKNSSPTSRFEGLIGRSPEMLRAYEIIERAAQTDIPVSIRGESGTGKELVANALKNLSDRREGPFIKINCASIPGELLESELFGFEKGAFTSAVKQKKGKLELADKGVLFLDEIGDMPLNLQVKLLRVLQENEFERLGGDKPITSDFRLITATNKDLEACVEQGQFRQDLFYRINGLPIYVPSLKSRVEDIALLVEHFLVKYTKPQGITKQITQSALDSLTTREWPGNVRELENFIYRLVTMVPHDIISEIDIENIDSYVQNISTQTSTDLIQSYIKSSILNKEQFQDVISHFEKSFIEYTLMKNDGNISKAGRMIGLPKTTLYSKMKKYDLH